MYSYLQRNYAISSDRAELPNAIIILLYRYGRVHSSNGTRFLLNGITILANQSLVIFFLSNTIIDIENKSIRLTLKSSKNRKNTRFVLNGARSWNANHTNMRMKRQRETAVKLLFPLKSFRRTYYSTCKTVDQSLSRVIHLKSVSSNKSVCKTSPRHGITAFKLETKPIPPGFVMP